jgi:uncharacterized membrane protein (DUF485 family)
VTRKEAAVTETPGNNPATSRAASGASTPQGSDPHSYRLPEHAVYEELHATADFQELRKRYRAFAIPWTLAFLAWYLTYVVMSNWATGLMNTKVVGNINVALVFGLLQFLSTFGIAWLYSRHANKSLDPLARKLDAQYKKETGR